MQLQVRWLQLLQKLSCLKCKTHYSWGMEVMATWRHFISDDKLRQMPFSSLKRWRKLPVKGSQFPVQFSYSESHRTASGTEPAEPGFQNKTKKRKPQQSQPSPKARAPSVCPLEPLEPCGRNSDLNFTLLGISFCLPWAKYAFPL